MVISFNTLPRHIGLGIEPAANVAEVAEQRCPISCQVLRGGDSHEGVLRQRPIC
jgi:hypothetical protein